MARNLPVMPGVRGTTLTCLSKTALTGARRTRPVGASPLAAPDYFRDAVEPDSTSALEPCPDGLLTRWRPHGHDERATLVNAAPEGKIVKITFLGKDSTPNDSPTLYETDRETYLVQGYVVTDPEALSSMRIPAGETVVEVPKRLMKYLPEDAHAEGDG